VDNLLDWAEQRLDALPGVARRPEFGNQTYFVAGSRFASLTDRTLVMHLPPAELTEALKLGVARPFVSAGATGRNGWVEIQLEHCDQAILQRLIAASHTSAQQSHRRSAPRRPRAARRTRPAPTKR